MVTTDFSGDGSFDSARALVIQPDGKIVAAGTSNADDLDDAGFVAFALARYNTDGTLDASFGTGGLVTTNFTDVFEEAFALAIQSDGKIVAAGFAVPDSFDFALARYNTDGSLDDGTGNDSTPSDSFGTAGVVITDFGGGSFDAIEDIAIQSDGKIVAAGESDSDFALARYNINGTLDSTFGTEGLVTTDFDDSFDAIEDIAIQSDGKIVTTGLSNAGSPSGNLHFAVARYNTDGSLDDGGMNDSTPSDSFGIAGIVLTDFSGDDSSSDQSQAVALQSDGKIVVAGVSVVFDPDFAVDFAVARYNTDGSLDEDTFGTVGFVTTNLGFIGSFDNAEALVVQPDGKIVVAGNSEANDPETDFALARYNTDGTLDTTFGTGGLVTTDFSGGGDSDFASALALQPDGKIVVAGETEGDISNDFALARYNTDGTLDTSFGIGGLVTTDFSGTGSFDEASAIAIQSDGKIVAAGETDGGGSIDFALARYNSDGSLDTTFGTGGLVTTDFSGSGSFEDAFALAIQSDGKIVAAGRSNANDPNGETDFALARYNSDGSLDDGTANDSTPGDSFGTGGLVTTDFSGSGSFDRLNDLVLQPDGKIVAGGQSDANDPDEEEDDFALARYNSDGTLDTTFGTGGLVLTDFSGDDSSDDEVEALAIQSNGKIVAAGESIPDDPNGEIGDDFALVRYNADGTLDTTFGAAGLVLTDFLSGSDDEVFAVGIQADGKIVAAGESNADDPNDFALARYEGDPAAPSITCAGFAITTGCTVNGTPGQMCVGTPGRDTIIGTSGSDVILGLEGNDTLNGLAGNDAICGDDGNDTINGGDGDDTLSGMNGRDTINGGKGKDDIFGGDGNDRLRGDANNDKLVGSNGDDMLNGGGGIDDECDGGFGTDTAAACENTTDVP